MTLCVGMLIASEFMPVSLLTPIAADLHATQGMAGQAISVSGLFAVGTSLFVASAASRFDLRNVLMFFGVLMLLSLVLVAEAPNFSVLMLARALLGVTIGGFWSLATAALMRMVSPESVPKALGVMYMGNAAATAFAAPVGSYLGGLIGWRGVFWVLIPLSLINLIWQFVSLPSLPSQRRVSASRVLSLLRLRHVRFAVVACMFTFAGAFASFTYLRPFLETQAHVSVSGLSLLLLTLGAASFIGTSAATALLKKRLFVLLWALPFVLAVVTVGVLLGAPLLAAEALALAIWGALNAALPVVWFNWIAREIADEPEAGGSLIVGTIQLAIMTGAGLGGLLLDHFSVNTTLMGGALTLVLAALVAGRERKLRR